MEVEDLTQGIESVPIFGPQCANSFKYVKTNVPGPGCDHDLFMEEFQGCSCSETCSEETCPCIMIFGPAYNKEELLRNVFSSDHPTRSIIECGKNCRCKLDTCSMRLVQKGIQSKLTVIKTPHKGFGLRTINDIEYLAFVCEYAGEVVSENEARKRLIESERFGNMNYLIAIKELSTLSSSNLFIDPKLEGNIGRFINHSCDPNLIMIPVRVNIDVPRLALFARRDISKGEELTFDYSGYASLEDDIQHSTKTQQQFSYSDISSHTTSVSADSPPKDNCINKHSVNDFPDSMISHALKRRKLADASSIGAAQKDDSLPSQKVSPDYSVQGLTFQSTKNYDNVLPTYETTKITTRNKMISRKSENDDSSECTSSVKRNICLCGTKICKGFLPYDDQLFGS